MLRSCQADGCETLTFGPLCLAHEPVQPPRRFPRGRPFRLAEREVTSSVRRIELTWPVAGQSSLRLPSRS